VLGALVISFVLLLFFGVPIAYSMGISSAIAIVTCSDVPWLVLPQRIFVAIDSFPMMAIPLFILAGELMNGGGITKRIVSFSSSLVGHITGGLAHVNIVGSMFFAGISGSAAADTASLGSILIPAMVKDGYEPAFAVAVTASAGTIGPIIPPSILMIIYGSITGISIGALFLGGFVPGVLIGLALMITAYIIARKRGYKAAVKATMAQRWIAFKGSILALIMPCIILGGILSGVFTATEAGVVALVYGLIVGFATKELKLNQLKKIFVDSAITSATVMYVIGSAQIMGWILAREQFPQYIVKTLLSISNNGTVIFLLIAFVLFILGFFVDATALLIILAPVFVPVVNMFGYDPVQFAVVAIMTLLVGGVTPPVGVLLFISCGIAKIKLSEGSRMIWPFVTAMIVIILACIFIPQLTTFVPFHVLGKV